MSFVVISTNGIYKRNSSNTGWVKRSLLLSQTGSIIQFNPKISLDNVLQHDDTRILLDLFVQQEEGGKHRSNVKVIDKSNSHNEISIISAEKSLRLRFPMVEIKDRWLQAFRYCLVCLNKHLTDTQQNNPLGPMADTLGSNINKNNKNDRNNDKTSTNQTSSSRRRSSATHQTQPHAPLLSTRHRDGLPSVRNATLVKKRIEGKTPRTRRHSQGNGTDGADSRDRKGSRRHSIDQRHDARSSAINNGGDDNDDDVIDEEEIIEEDGLTQWVDEQKQLQDKKINSKNNNNNNNNQQTIRGGVDVEFTTSSGHDNDDDEDTDVVDGSDCDDGVIINAFSKEEEGLIQRDRGNNVHKRVNFDAKNATKNDNNSTSSNNRRNSVTTSQPRYAASMATLEAPLTQSQVNFANNAVINTPSHNITPDTNDSSQQHHKEEEDVIDTEPTFLQRNKPRLILIGIILIILTIFFTFTSHIVTFHISSSYYNSLWPLKYQYNFDFSPPSADNTDNHNHPNTLTPHQYHHNYNLNPYLSPVNQYSLDITYPNHILMKDGSKIEFGNNFNTQKDQIPKLQFIMKKIESILIPLQSPSIDDIPFSNKDYNLYINQLNQIYDEFNVMVNGGTSKNPKKRINGLDTAAKLVLEYNKIDYLQQYIMIMDQIVEITERFNIQLEYDSVKDNLNAVNSLSKRPSLSSQPQQLNYNVNSYSYGLDILDDNSIGNDNVDNNQPRLVKLTTPTMMLTQIQSEMISLQDLLDILIDDITTNGHHSEYVINQDKLTNVNGAMILPLEHDNNNNNNDDEENTQTSNHISTSTLINILSHHHLKHHTNPTSHTINFIDIEHDDGDEMNKELVSKLKNVNPILIEKYLKLLLSLDITIYDLHYHNHYSTRTSANSNASNILDLKARGLTHKKLNLLNNSLFFKILQSKKTRLEQWILRLNPIINTNNKLIDANSNVKLYISDIIPFEYNTVDLQNKIVSNIPQFTLPTYQTDHDTIKKSIHKLNNEQYLAYYYDYLKVYNLYHAFFAQKTHYSNQLSPISLSSYSSTITQSYYYSFVHQKSYLLSVGVVFFSIMVIMFFGLRYQELLIDKLTSHLPTQIGIGLGVSVLLSIGLYLFGLKNITFSLINVLSWVGIVILTQIQFFFELMDMLAVEEVDDFDYNAVNDENNYNAVNDDNNYNDNTDYNTQDFANTTNLANTNPDTQSNNIDSTVINEVDDDNDDEINHKVNKRDSKRSKSKHVTRPSHRSSKRRPVEPSSEGESGADNGSEYDDDGEDEKMIKKNDSKNNKKNNHQSATTTTATSNESTTTTVVPFKSNIDVQPEAQLAMWYGKHQQPYKKPIIPTHSGCKKLNLEEQKIILALQLKFPYLLQITDYSWQPGQWKDFGVYDDVAVQKNMIASPSAKKDDGSLLARGMKTVPVPVDVLMALLWDTPKTKALYDPTCNSVTSLREINNHVSVQRQVYSGQRICNDRYLNIMAGWQRVRWSTSISKNKQFNELSNEYRIKLVNIHKLPTITSTPYFGTQYALENDYNRQFHSVYRNRMELYGLYDRTTDFTTWPIQTTTSNNGNDNDNGNIVPPKSNNLPQFTNPQHNDVFNILNNPQHALQLPLNDLERTSEGFILLDDGYAMLACSIMDKELLDISFVKNNPPDKSQSEAFLHSGGFLLRSCLIPYNLTQPNNLFDQKAIDHGKKILKNVPLQTTNFIKLANDLGHQYVFGTLFVGIGKLTLPGMANFIVKKVCCTAPALVNNASKYLLKDSKDPKINHINTDLFYA